MNNTSKIGDILPFKMRKQYVKNQLQRGLVFKLEIAEEIYEKYFIFMGYDRESKESYGFFINTPKKDPALSRKNIVVSDFQVPIYKKLYPFLKYDSNINCFSYEGTDFLDMFNNLVQNPSKICGHLEPETITEIEEVADLNRVFSDYEKNILFGNLDVPNF